MASKASKKTITGPERTHARIQIDIPVDMLPKYRLWCMLNGTDMTADVTEHIAARLEGAKLPPAKSKPRHK